MPEVYQLVGGYSSELPNYWVEFTTIDFFYTVTPDSFNKANPVAKIFFAALWSRI